MGKRMAIVNVNLEFEIPNDLPEGQIDEYLSEVDLPDNYVCGSFEFVKLVDDD